MPNQGHKVEGMFDGLMKFLDAHETNLMTTLTMKSAAKYSLDADDT